ncbi:phosphoesterase [Thermaurantimonas aggregans]|uniref:Phosphoesterase n=1 Tax=Thermaurantimonas aggregans TaxID=2173829 RepID=A0A401XNX0_9FLAO|nr:metallophosphoesterase [Thermaurantimonas aggregans]MCX8149828.1 metallophosphoesterase [Thermaurantimonas aggregans]GCD78709.1 phosphoesterase [Thermaurantimonas aggregans]
MNSVYLLRFLISLIFLIAIDYYAWQAFRTGFQSSWPRMVYWVTTIAFYLSIFSLVWYVGDRSARYYPAFWIFGAMILLYVPKMVIAAVLLIEDFARALGWIANTAFKSHFDLSRREFVSKVAVGLAAIPMASILHGLWKGKYLFKIHRVPLSFQDLPDAFDGFRIVQISDLHIGSFRDVEPIEEAVRLINKQKPDLVLFTGDWVNNVAEETKPFIEYLSKIEARYGKYAILGNHDYGDYVPWESMTEKAANLEKLIELQKEAGFINLRNEGVRISLGSDSIYVAGVENFGAPPFPQYGDLKRALDAAMNNDFIVLMSHDPSHFDLEIKFTDEKIHLTLSGHTHGMQFGVEIPGWIKWSPVKWRYPKWAGLYKENDRYLYVNRGLGFIGFPGRVGIWPEIAVIELTKRNI